MSKERLREKIQGKSPEEIADIVGLPLQRALIDFDPFSERLQTIGADPADLGGRETIAVKTIIGEASVLTIVAHPGAEQDVANAFAQRPEMSGWAASYGEDYLEQGVMGVCLPAPDWPGRYGTSTRIGAERSHPANLPPSPQQSRLPLAPLFPP